VNQIHEASEPFCREAGLKTTCVYGGISIEHHKRQLGNGADIVVGTPGRLIDLVERGFLDLENVSYLVLDEADRMLDMGFMPQIEEIIKNLPEDRQTLMWSATWPREVEQLADQVFTGEPIRIQIGDENLTVNSDIHQSFFFMDESNKLDKLSELLNQITKDNDQKILVFSNKKADCDNLAYQLVKQGFSADSLHGNKSQSRRDLTIGQFKSGHKRILIATDVASRGLDIKEIGSVVNLDFPQTVPDYVHRIGRTGRNGNTGKAFTMFTIEDGWAADELVELLQKSGNEVPAELPEMGKQYKREKRMKKGANKRNRSQSHSRSNGGSFFEREEYQGQGNNRTADYDGYENSQWEDGGNTRSRGGYNNNNSRGGYNNSRGGGNYNRPRRDDDGSGSGFEGGRGGHGGSRGGYNNSRGGYNNNRMEGGDRDGGSRGGYNNNRMGGGDRDGGSRGGYNNNRMEGGDRDGGSRGGYRDRDNNSRGGHRERENHNDDNRMDDDYEN
jgi:ATP-dependent RNA helicase DDX5/DBP2